jgi:hypothetical protein
MACCGNDFDRLAQQRGYPPCCAATTAPNSPAPRWRTGPVNASACTSSHRRAVANGYIESFNARTRRRCWPRARAAAGGSTCPARSPALAGSPPWSMAWSAPPPARTASPTGVMPRSPRRRRGAARRVRSDRDPQPAGPAAGAAAARPRPHRRLSELRRGGHLHLRHVPRTDMRVHVVDCASTQKS